MTGLPLAAWHHYSLRSFPSLCKPAAIFPKLQKFFLLISLLTSVSLSPISFARNLEIFAHVHSQSSIPVFPTAYLTSPLGYITEPSSQHVQK